MYLCQITKCICLILQNVFVSDSTFLSGFSRLIKQTKGSLCSLSWCIIKELPHLSWCGRLCQGWHITDKEADRPKDTHTDWKTRTQTERQTHRPKDRHTDQKTEQKTDTETERQPQRPKDIHTPKHIDWQTQTSQGRRKQLGIKMLQTSSLHKYTYSWPTIRFSSR